MKKLILFLLIMGACFTASSCGKDDGESKSSNSFTLQGSGS